MSDQTSLQFDSEQQRLFCRGVWNLTTITSLKHDLQKINLLTIGNTKKISIDGENIQTLDSSGAWLLIQFIKKLNTQKIIVQLINFSAAQQKLFSLTEEQAAKLTQIPRTKPLNWLARIGRLTVQYITEAIYFLSFTGELTLQALRVLRHPRRLRWRALFSTIEKTGYQALPIIALLSFMIGVVMTYQMGLQLQNYGANIFIVDLLGLSILREFAPLLTAIIVAGRTGSAFTAQLGTMKLNEEIDALNTLGVTPAEILLLPRIAGLIIALPLLTVWSDIFSIVGGMVMSKNMLHIPWGDFLHRFHKQVSVSSLVIGLGKAPVFALLIGGIGCFQGMRVLGGADSVGTQTTKSVVQAIFFIIVADALFSVIFSELGL